MNWLKQRWEITKNWQLIYPIIGALGLGYSAFKIAAVFSFSSMLLTVVASVAIFFVLLHLTLKLFKFLEKRWKVNYRWRVIRIFIVFAITGSLSVIVLNPIFDAIGITKENFEFPAGIGLYYIIKFFLILPFYKVFLVFFGWLFKEYHFFLNFALKLARRLGLKRIVEKFESK